jgi:hypothetical protein
LKRFLFYMCSFFFVGGSGGRSPKCWLHRRLRVVTMRVMRNMTWGAGALGLQETTPPRLLPPPIRKVLPSFHHSTNYFYGGNLNSYSYRRIIITPLLFPGISYKAFRWIIIYNSCPKGIIGISRDHRRSRNYFPRKQTLSVLFLYKNEFEIKIKDIHTTIVFCD